MGIRVEHQPSPAVVGGAAFAAGHGIESRRQAEADRQFALQAQALAEQQQANQQRMQLAAQQQQFQQEQIAFQNMLRGQQMAMNYDLGLQSLGLRQAMMNPQGMEQMGPDGQMGLSPHNQQMWEMGTAKNLEQQIADVRRQFNSAPLNHEGKRVYGDLMGKLRAIEGQRDQIRPAQYSQLLNQWLAEAQSAQLESYVQQPPTIQDELGTRMHDLGTGMAAILQPNGDIRVFEIDPMLRAQMQAQGRGATGGARGQSDPGSSATMSAEEYLSDPKRSQELYEEAQQSLFERAAELDPTGGVPQLTPDMIQQEMIRLYGEKKRESLRALGIRDAVMQEAARIEQLEALASGDENDPLTQEARRLLGGVARDTVSPVSEEVSQTDPDAMSGILPVHPIMAIADRLNFDDGAKEALGQYLGNPVHYQREYARAAKDLATPKREERKPGKGIPSRTGTTHQDGMTGWQHDPILSRIGGMLIGSRASRWMLGMEVGPSEEEIQQRMVAKFAEDATEKPHSIQRMLAEGKPFENWVIEQAQRLANDPIKDELAKAMKEAGESGDPRKYLTTESINAHIMSGSDDPAKTVLEHVVHVMKDTKNRLHVDWDKLPATGKYSREFFENAPEVWTGLEFAALRPGEVYRDGITGQFRRKSVKSSR